jgi:hypothetical protein
MGKARVPLDCPARGLRGSQHLARLRKEGHKAPGSLGKVSAQDNGVGALAGVTLRPRRRTPPGGGDRGERLRPQCRAARRTAPRVLVLAHKYLQYFSHRRGAHVCALMKLLWTRVY